VNCEEHPGQDRRPRRHDHADHADCLDRLRTAYAGQHIDVTISTVPPTVRGPFTLEAPFVCPHGVRHWAEPTSAQLAQWTADSAP
jgi:hypothetical protein